MASYENFHFVFLFVMFFVFNGTPKFQTISMAFYKVLKLVKSNHESSIALARIVYAVRGLMGKKG